MNESKRKAAVLDLFIMAKKKAKKKSSGKKVQKPRAAQKKSAKKAKKKISPRKPAAKRTAARATSTRNAPKKPAKSIRRVRESAVDEFQRTKTLPGDADSQGLSDLESADSESVSELLEEGNTFEAGVISGVERADNSEGREVRTREVPEDDVPEEYLDQD
jgi:hypothetical protein